MGKLTVSFLVSKLLKNTRRIKTSMPMTMVTFRISNMQKRVRLLVLRTMKMHCHLGQISIKLMIVPVVFMEWLNVSKGNKLQMWRLMTL